MNRNCANVCKMIGLAAAATTFALAAGSGTALAQDNFYALSYFSNANTPTAPDATLRLVNDGFISDSSPAGDLCAAIYVFTSDEQLNECCSCKITPNGLLALGVNTNLTRNPLTGIRAKRGAVKVVSSAPTTAGTCDPTALTPTLGIHGWLTHIQKSGTGTSVSWPQTEEELQDASLSTAEAGDLAEDCMVAIELGSGQGTCSCTDAGR